MRDYIPIVFPFIALFRIFRHLARQPEFRGLIIIELVLIASGAVFYHYVEQWSYLDAVYFCVVTLATVGYGDFAPKTDLGRLFAIPYIIVGVAMLGVFIQIAGKTALQGLQDRSERKRAKEQAARDTQMENDINEE